MADPATPPNEVLETAQYAGATIYLSAYVRRMARAIGVDDSDTEGINAMVMQMVEPLNLATETVWRAICQDLEGQDEALQRFRESLNCV